MPVAWVVERKAGERLGPVLKNPDQPSRRNLMGHGPFVDISQPGTFQGGFDPEFVMVEGEQPFHVAAMAWLRADGDIPSSVAAARKLRWEATAATAFSSTRPVR